MPLSSMLIKSSSRHIIPHIIPPSMSCVAVSAARNPLVDRYSLIRRFFTHGHHATHTSLVAPPSSVSWPLRTRRSPTTQIKLVPRRFGSLIDRNLGLLQRGKGHKTSSFITECRNLSTGRDDPERIPGTSSIGTSPTPTPTPPPPPPPLSHPEHLPRHLEDYPRLYQRLAQSLPHPHRPTREDLLGVATGFWQRIRIRFKWFTVRSFRRFNADDISAFITWFVMSQTLWIFIGTTTFASVVFATANSLQLQHYIARAISDYLTSETGVTIIFESAIVPKWKDSRLSFKNVYVSRRPHTKPPRRFKYKEHVAAVGYDVSNHPYNYHVENEEEEEVEEVEEEDVQRAEEDWNRSFFDLNIDSVDVTLSLGRWFDGKGLVEDAVVKGVRGVLDRRSVHWDPEHPLDPLSFRHVAQPGDFELESLQLEDVLITVYQPGNFRPYTGSIFRADLHCFRKRWICYDLLSAENIVGQFDNCLFSLHKPQSVGRTTEKDLKDGDWARMSRIRIDGVNIDHLQSATTTEGPISWITSGKVDAVLDIKFPRDPNEDLPLNAIFGEIADAITSQIGSKELDRIPGQRELSRPPLGIPDEVMQWDFRDDGTDVVVIDAGADDMGIGASAPSVQQPKTKKVKDTPKIVIDIDLRFRDLKAAVPMFTPDLSYVNNALVRPIVAFMNAHRTLVPIHCRVVKDLTDFDGSWTMWDSGLMDALSLKVYDALAYHVTHSDMARQRIKTVSLWSLQMTASAVLAALRAAMDPLSMQLRDAYASGQYYGYGLQGVVDGASVV